MRTALIIGLILIYTVLGIVDLRNQNISTGVSAFLLAVVNGLLFFAGNKT